MKKAVMCLLFLIILLPAAALADNLRVTYIDVGQGDAALVQCGGQSMLIDTGPASSSEALLSFLDHSGIVALDYVVGTYPYDDHIGGMAAVLSKYDVVSIWMPRVRNETRAFDEALLAIRQSGHLIDPPVAGNEFQLGDAVITVLAPIRDAYENLNDYSIVLRIDHGRNSFLFAGDAGQASIDEMLASRSDISANVFKVNNHGSAVGNMQAFVSAISPSIAVISCGDGNAPASVTLNRLEAAGALILRTDEKGNILIESDRTTLFHDQQVALGEGEWFGRINTREVNIRKGPGKSEDRIAYLDEGTAVRVMLTIENDSGETWYLIEINGIQGYVRGDLIDPVNPLAQGTADEIETTDTDDGLDPYFVPKSSPSPVPETAAPTGEPTASPTAPMPTASPVPTASASNATIPPLVTQNVTAPETQAPETQFFGNAISKFFHRATCDSLPSQKNRILFTSRDDAIQQGYIPCLACSP